jgi:hypothetical protein
MRKVAVIGCGYRRKNLVRSFHQLRAPAAIFVANRPRAAVMAR